MPRSPKRCNRRRPQAGATATFSLPDGQPVPDGWRGPVVLDVSIPPNHPLHSYFAGATEEEAAREFLAAVTAGFEAEALLKRVASAKPDPSAGDER